MNSRRLWFVALAPLVLGAAAACFRGWLPSLAPEDWPEFRGPGQNGCSAARGLPVEWGRDKNVVWKTVLPGRAWSSPVIAGDRVYLTNAVTGKDDDDLHAPVSLRVLALDAVTGRVIWDQEALRVENPYPAVGFNDKNSHASATPAFSEGRIYAHFGNFGSACFDESGVLIWKTTEPSFKTELGTGSCPVIIGDLMIFNCDGVDEPFVVALDKATGQERWRRPRAIADRAKNRYALSTPTLIEVNGRRQLITVGTHIVQSLHPEDGSEIWRIAHRNYCAVPRPVFADGLVFFTTGFEHPSLCAINPNAGGELTDDDLEWEIHKNVPLTSSPVVVDGDLYMVSDTGTVTCLESKTGTVRWSERLAKATSASPLYADGKIYIQDEYGTGYVIKPGRKLQLLATNSLEEKSFASYAVHGHHLLIRTHHALWCVGRK